MKKSFENDQLIGCFQSFFFSELFSFFNISRKKNSKTSKVNQQLVCIKSLNISSFLKKSGQDNYF